MIYAIARPINHLTFCPKTELPLIIERIEITNTQPWHGVRLFQLFHVGYVAVCVVP